MHGAVVNKCSNSSCHQASDTCLAITHVGVRWTLLVTFVDNTSPRLDRCYSFGRLPPSNRGKRSPSEEGVIRFMYSIIPVC